MQCIVNRYYQDDGGKKPCVLVVSARFPSINQAWIDTYLEQLLKHSIDFAIYSGNKSSQVYHEKVDRLSLRKKLLDFDLKKSSLFRSLAKDALLQPWRLFRSLVTAWRISRKLSTKYDLHRVSLLYRLVRFKDAKWLFKDIDIIHSHSEQLAFEFLFLSLMHQVPLVFTFHGLMPRGVPSLSDTKRKILYSQASRVLANTRFAMRQAESVGCPPEKITILPQGLPLEEFPFSPLPCPNEEEVLQLLSVGRFHREKGYGYSFLAVARLVRAGVNLHFHVVGEGPDRKWMEGLIARMDISEYVTLYSAMQSNKLIGMYSRAHLFLLASLGGQEKEWNETQGVVLQEAQASGCIPIATRVGGIPECVNDKQDAILVKDRSSRAICEAVRYLLDRSDEWQSYQENGRRNVEQNFSADIIGKKMAGILRDIAIEGQKH